MTAIVFIGDQVHAQFDYGVAFALGPQTGLVCSENFMIRQCQYGNVMPAQVSN